MIKEILQIGNPILSQKSKKVQSKQIGSKEIGLVITDLIDTLESVDEEAAGLSAVQIGYMHRITVVKDMRKKPRSKYIVMINPEFTVVNQTPSLVWEGCMSINKDNNKLFGPVERAKTISVSFLDQKGIKQTFLATDFFSHLIQHEIDHMDGILFLKYVKNLKNIWKEDELEKHLAKYKHFPEVL